MLALYAITIIFLKLVVTFPSAKLCSHEYPDCPNGCVRLLDSGYYMELVKLPFETARVEYLKRETTLCTPDSVEEWVDVVERTSLNFRTWAGQKRTDERPPNTGRDNKKINRLVPPAIPEGNGWNPTPQCSAHPTIDTPTFGILPSEMAKVLWPYWRWPSKDVYTTEHTCSAALELIAGNAYIVIILLQYVL